MPKTKILIVDDEEDILDLLEYNLQKEGYQVLRASDGESALATLKEENPKLVLLDIMMPRMDGVETCRRMREMEEGKQCFIIFLTARSEEYSELAGFEAGADDYIAKPIKTRILMSRIHAMLRRGKEKVAEATPESTIRVHDLEIKRDEYMVYQEGKPIGLAKKEFELLEFLASKPGKVFPRELLLEKVWGTDVLVVDRTIDVHIRKLREKLGKDYIETVKGVGYKFRK
ncbi:MAG: response regulator transcription factor [Bacteroidia bacterium]|nr:response regulator transcription factor [Bacteroidia bacterium]